MRPPLSEGVSGARVMLFVCVSEEKEKRKKKESLGTHFLLTLILAVVVSGYLTSLSQPALSHIIDMEGDCTLICLLGLAGTG